MQRIMIMGPPGAGKSTLARALGRKFGLPVFHLDHAFHMPGWVQAPDEQFRAEVERIAELPKWVIDGNYRNFIAQRYRSADTIIYLDLPSWVSMLRVVRRMIGSYGRVRPDGPAGCPEQVSFEFLQFVWTWRRQNRAATLALVEAFAGRKIVLRGMRQQTCFLRG